MMHFALMCVYVLVFMYVLNNELTGYVVLERGKLNIERQMPTMTNSKSICNDRTFASCVTQSCKERGAWAAPRQLRSTCCTL